jgi:hypothetical protein
MTLAARPILMATGHRDLDHPEAIAEAIADLLTGIRPQRVIAGGARGADDLVAIGAMNQAVPLTIMLPNRWYRQRYNLHPGPTDTWADEVVYVVDRPLVGTWRQRWNDERWWLDNFTRNVAMVDRATEALCVSSEHPAELINTSGGTAHCLGELAKAWCEELWWIPDHEVTEAERVRLNG